MIKLEQITKTYTTGKQSFQALKGIDLNIERGAFVSIVGPSGSGKSTLLNVIGILDDYDQGHYALADTSINKALPEAKRAFYRNKFLGFIFQSFNLLHFKNAMENVALPLYYRKVPRRKRNALALEFLDRVGLRDWAEHMPNEMSGGQQQRVAIARALIAEPELILADEPTGALASQTSIEVMNLFKDLNDAGKTIVVVTHDPEVAQLSDRIISLKDGVIAEDVQTTKH